MTTLHIPHPGDALVDLAARVAAFFVSRADTVRHPDWEVAQYGTQTFRDGVLIAETPEITYGQLRGLGETAIR